MMFLEYKEKVVCASKYFSAENMRKIFSLGIKNFGENRVEDLLLKKKVLHDLDITYHFIGHLQRNKTKQVINEIDVLHSLDSIKLAENIQKYRKSELLCFIQVNLTDESQKNGIKPYQLAQFLLEIKKYDKIRVIGLMTIGKIDDPILTEQVFKDLSVLNSQFELPGLSIGMSSDYKLALKYHPTFIRIGSLFKGVI